VTAACGAAYAGKTSTGSGRHERSEVSE